MAKGNPQTITDAYGIEYTFYTDGVGIWYYSSLDPTPRLAFNQPLADSPIDLQSYPNDALVVFYLSAGQPAGKVTRDGGESWEDA